MGEAPETMWVFPRKDWFDAGASTHKILISGARDTEYRRADLPATDAQALANPKVQALVEALRWYADETNWEQTSAANDDPHDGRLRDIWNGDFADGWTIARTALAAMKETK